jgi:epsilon-lactone hydrolase
VISRILPVKRDPRNLAGGPETVAGQSSICAHQMIMQEQLILHPLDHDDASITAAIRTSSRPTKGLLRGIEGRGQFDALMESVSPRDDVTFEEDTLGGIAGLWVIPSRCQAGTALLHLHGGWFSFGTAKSFRHLVAHIAARASARAFVPEYRLAPEHPFPAATDDVAACYRALTEKVERIALTGDSAGGNLALVQASRVASEPPTLWRSSLALPSCRR